MSAENGERRTNVQIIREVLATNPQATKAVVEQVAGRKIHSPDLAKVRKDMGIVWQRGKQYPDSVNGQAVAVPAKAPPKRRQTRRAPAIRVTTRLPDGGIACLSAMIELAQIHGKETFKKAAEAVASF